MFLKYLDILEFEKLSRKTQMWEQRKDNIEWEKREIEKAEEERANPEKTLQKQRRRKRRQNPIKEHK